MSAADVETYLRDFQFKVLNYITCTNVLLKKMRILDSDMCTFCNRFEEDIEHLFFHFPFSLSFWKDFEAFWNINMNEIINFSVQDIIVGISNEVSPFKLLYFSWKIHHLCVSCCVCIVCVRV